MRAAIATRLRSLPAGTLAVGAGLGILGLAGYAFLALGSRSLTAVDFSALSVLWALVWAVGPGLFFPLEQELARVVATRFARKEPLGGVIRRMAVVAGAILAALVVITIVSWNWLTNALFDGNDGLTLALLANLAALAVAHFSRGVLAGTGSYGRYGLQLAIDGILRCLFALAVLGLESPVALGFALAAAQIVAVILTVRKPPLASAEGTLEWAEITRGMGTLLVSQLCAQIIVNAGVVIAKLSSDNEALAGELLIALVLARVPVFLYAAVQAGLMPSLARSLVDDENGHEFKRILKQALFLVSLMGMGGILLCTYAGPWILQTAFAAEGLLTRTDFFWLSVGAAFYIGALALGQALLAQGRHGAQAAGWVIGLAVMAGVTLAPLSPIVRVEAGFLAGSLAALIAHSILLLYGLRQTRKPIVVSPAESEQPGVSL